MIKTIIFCIALVFFHSQVHGGEGIRIILVKPSVETVFNTAINDESEVDGIWTEEVAGNHRIVRVYDLIMISEWLPARYEWRLGATMVTSK